MVRILLADDHTVMRAGLRLLLERHEDFEVVGEAADGRQAVDIATELKPAVVVMDIAIVRLSMHRDESYVLRSLNAGARAYLLKDAAEADLVSAIQAIIEGKSFFSPGVRALLKEDYIHRLA